MAQLIDGDGDHAWYRFALVVAFVAGLGFFALSFVLLGILPGRSLATLVKEQAPQNMAAYTLAEERGRQIYATEGCGYCHSQQVRFVAADVARWGAPTEAWETKFDAPQLWGTRRVGPDLAREGGVRPDDWQLTHLFNPRATIRDSVMPGYPWHFDGDATKPKPSALDLVAYLQALGRPRQLSGYEVAEANPTTSTMGGEHASVPGLIPRPNANPNAPIVGGTTTPFSTVDSGPAAIEHGRALFAANCASCHGERGGGDGLAVGSLMPAPADLSANRYTTERVAAVLWNGVAGSAMPAWRDMPVRDLQDLTAFVATLSAVGSPNGSEAALIGSGSSIFATNCTGCHGAGGLGDGVAASSMTPRPTNFSIEQPSAARAQAVLTDGIPGTAMTAWAKVLSAGDRAAVVAYIRSLYRPDPFDDAATR